ncbi:MAG: prepilin-type N-terminal cleavage/methylation domain-containing protein [Pedosphaera sp.]|nr:prepilin-type N-terminal cleavage/methylation domain-containing protein [Pedosphaera sp.]
MTRTTQKPLTAFTLIELLVVVAIIGILAALLLPALSRAKASSHRTKCINNLKQLAGGIQMYADDHGDQLPGPIWAGNYDTYDDEYSTRLPYYIATYLGMPAPSRVPRVLLPARCPAAADHWKDPGASEPAISVNRPLSYLVSLYVTNLNSGRVMYPFGYPFSGGPAGNAGMGTNAIPKKLREIYTPTISLAVTDADKRNAKTWARFYPFLPAEPAHGKVRNRLYFDWHVEAARP